MKLAGRMPDHLVVHCGHHKVLTVYFQNVLSAFCRLAGLTLANTATGDLFGPPMPEVMLVHDSDLNRIPESEFHGTHVIRDPRHGEVELRGSTFSGAALRVDTG